MKRILICAMLFTGGFLIGRFSNPAGTTERVTQVLVRRDTVRVVEPTPLAVRHLKVVTERLPLAVADTVTNPIVDSVAVQVPVEQRVYSDENYRVVVSGFKARLDSLEFINTNTTALVANRKKPRFSLGFMAGYGFTPRGFQPFIGVGVSVNIASF